MVRSTSLLFTPLAFLVCILLIPDLAAAQTDLSGTWTYSQSKSDQPTGGGGGRGRMMSGGNSDLTITQEGNTITIKSMRQGREGAREVTDTYVADGEPHEVQSGRGSSTVTTSWKESVLIVARSLSTRMGDVTITTSYALQTDGKELVVTRKMPAMGGRSGGTVKSVYDKK